MMMMMMLLLMVVGGLRGMLNNAFNFVCFGETVNQQQSTAATKPTSNKTFFSYFWALILLILFVSKGTGLKV